MNTDAAVTAETAGTRPDRPLSLWSSSFWIGFFSFREMLRRKRILSVGILMLLPVVLTLAWRLLDDEGVISAPLLLANLSGVIYIHFMVAVVSLAFGISAIGESADEGTIIYYWTRPLRREAIYLGRLVAAQTVSAVLVTGSLVAAFLTMTVGNFGVIDFAFVKLYVSSCLVIVFGALVYTAIFACVGTGLKKPMLPSLLFAFGWESIGGNVPLKLQELTIVFHLRNLLHNPAESHRSMPNLLQELKRTLLQEVPPPSWQSFLTLSVVILVSVALGCWLLRRKEIFR